MSDLTSQKPQDYDASGMKLLNKTAEPVQVTGARAVAMFADTKHNCHFYASSALPALATAPSAAFLCQQLVLDLHAGQNALPRFMPAPAKPQKDYESRNKQRHEAWKQRSSTLQALAQTMQRQHPDSAFLLHVEGRQGCRDLSGGFTSAKQHLHAAWLGPVCPAAAQISRCACRGQ